jgi:hypothetical protein
MLPSHSSAVRFARFYCFGLIASVAACSSAVVNATPINYGNRFGHTVNYTMITEDSGTDTIPPALYGPPTINGNTLDFNPTAQFAASSSNASVPDMTDGQLQFMVEVNNSSTGSLNNIYFNESGTTMLMGPGGDTTATQVTGDVFIDIVEVNGTGINPIKLQRQINLSPFNGEFGLGTAGGGAANFQTNWNGALAVNLQQALLDNQFPAGSRVTKISVNLDNTLTAVSVAGTSASIAKTDFRITVPEPATCSLVLLASAIAFLSRRVR